MRSVVFTDHQDAGGVPVDPVDDPRPQNAVDPGKAVPAVKHQGVDQCPALMAGGGMHHHPLRLVDQDHVVILVQDIQRDLLRRDLRRLRVRDVADDAVPRFQLPVALRGGTVHGDAAFLDQLLHMGARHLRHGSCKEHVQARSCLCGISLKLCDHFSCSSFSSSASVFISSAVSGRSSSSDPVFCCSAPAVFSFFRERKAKSSSS